MDMNILIVEDEKLISDSISEYLKSDGYVCNKAFNYPDAEESVYLYNYDVVLLDITLPGGNGLDLIEILRKKDKKTGIIIISARNSLDDKITGLKLGADDYLTKPFHLAELNARIKSVIRRKNFEGENEIVFDKIKINLNSQEVFVCDKPMLLTKREFDLLMYFVSNKEKVITKEAIAEHLIGNNADLLDSFDFIYTHIRNLRKKIMDLNGPDYIQTIYSIGYRFKKQ
jgi:DNA-binding response OmpR family regulator